MTIIQVVFISNITPKMICECCGMRLRASPGGRASKEKLRAKRKLITAAVSKYMAYDNEYNVLNISKDSTEPF